MKIHIIFTGGTIDSFYDGTKDTAIPNKYSIIPQYLKGLKLYQTLKFSEICMKDSRSLNKKNRVNILKVVEKSSCKKIVITHGTYTMPDTAKFLKANLKRKDQTIIFTGSMIPMNGFPNSDGPFNLGFTLAKLEETAAGIFVCMNGNLFTPEEVKKDISEGRFLSIFNK